MPSFSVKVDGISTSASANTYKTILGLKMASTTGHKARLRRLTVGGGGGAAQDLQVSVKIDRTTNATDGTSTSVNVATILQHEADSVASNVNAIGKNYTVEPTVLAGDAGAGGSLNTRGALVLEWQRGEGPEWGITQTLCILAAPGAATAATLDVGVEWDE